VDWKQYRRNYNEKVKELWGRTDVGYQNIKEAVKWGRKGEQYALSVMPSLGFSNISDYANRNNQFFIDFIATYNGKRVLVDATIKHSAYIPEKIKLARDLDIPLYILFVSPNFDKHYLRLVEDKHHSVIKIPMSAMRALACEVK